MRQKIINLILMIAGIPIRKPKSTEHFKIKGKMITPNVVQMDMDSFRAYMKTDEAKRKNGAWL
ncbi:hypothetical protein [Vibrio phage LP.2]|nr:hypothetical protein [Vibrio phage LP.2]